MAIDYRTEPEYWEYLDGVAHPKVSPRDRHAIAQVTVASMIRNLSKKRGQTGTEWDIWLPDREKLTKFIPDVSFFSFERLRALSGEDREFPPCAPDVAVEVRSPGDSRGYLEKKIGLYLSHGSLVVLDVDPVKRTIVVHDRAGNRTLCESDAFAHCDVPWLEFPVSDVFVDLDIPDDK